MVPVRSDVTSRLDVDLASVDGTGTTIPIVVANMTAVAGRRMAETVARRGGLAVIPQDIPLPVLTEVVGWVKERHPVLDALHLIPKRAHGAVVVVDAERRPVGIVTAEDCARVDRYTQLEDVMSTEVLTLDAGDLQGPTALRAGFDALHDARRRFAPVVRDGVLVGLLT